MCDTHPIINIESVLNINTTFNKNTESPASAW